MPIRTFGGVLNPIKTEVLQPSAGTSGSFTFSRNWKRYLFWLDKQLFDYPESAGNYEHSFVKRFSLNIETLIAVTYDGIRLLTPVKTENSVIAFVKTSTSAGVLYETIGSLRIIDGDLYFRDNELTKSFSLEFIEKQVNGV